MMKSKLFYQVLVFAGIMSAHSVSSQVIDDKSKYIYVEADVIDTVKLESLKAEKLEKFNKDKEERIVQLKIDKGNIAQLIALGKDNGKIQDEVLYNYAQKVINSYNNLKQAIYERHPLFNNRDVIEEVKKLMQKQDDTKVMKKFKKKKVSNLFVPYLSAVLVEHDISINKVAQEKPDLSIPPENMPYKKGLKKIMNPNNRAYCYVNDQSDLDEIDKAMQMKGWEWLEKEKSEEVHTMAPFSMTYKKYESHPLYRVYEDKVFDNDGNLVFQASLLRDDKVFKYFREALLKEIYIADYKANKYDILQAPAETQEDVKNMLGLPFKPSVNAEAAKKKQKIVNDYFEKGMKADFATGSRRQRAKARREAEDAELKMGALLLGTLLDANNNSNFTTAYKFKQQIEEDHKYDLDGVWKISRASDTSFKITFMNGQTSTSTYTGLATINQTKPYHWQWSIKLIPNEEIIVIDRLEYLMK